MGHIVGPTTQGMSDSEQALEYDSPKKTPYPSLVFPFFKLY
ncbi:phage holin [Bacillus sp. FSL K6-1005]